MTVKDVLSVTLNDVYIVICKKRDDIRPLYWGRAISSLIPENLMNKEIRYIYPSYRRSFTSLTVVVQR